MALVNPGAHLSAFREAVGFLVTRRALILAMAHREISSRYAGQMLGILWAVGHPLFQMAVFVFVFGFVFQQKLGGSHSFPRDYTVYILCGLASWLSLAPILATSTTVLRGSANLIKQFTFDSRVLPAREVVVGSIVWMVSVAIVVVYSVIRDGSASWTYLLIPVLAVLQGLIALGFAWGLAAISVFFRDLKDVVTLVNSIMIYVLPIVYLPDWLPPQFQGVIYANPLSYNIWLYQDVFYYGRIEHPAAWVVSAVVSVLIFTTGYRLFRRLSPSFGSVL